MILKLKRRLISILCVLLCVCVAVALNINATETTFNASADVITATIPEVQNYYQLNDKVALPTSIETKVNPEEVDSPTFTADNGVIIYPDGRAYPIIDNKEFTFNLTGLYTLKYFGAFENQEIVAEKDFSVIDSLYGFSLDNESFIDFATAEYMQSKISAGEFAPHTKEAHNTVDTKLTHSGEEALSVNLTKGTEFIYSKAIDLRNAGANGLTDIISFEPRAEDWDYVPVDADGDGIQDLDGNGNPKFTWVANKVVARKLIIKLTDCYDSSKYIKMIVDTPQTTATYALRETPYVRACTDTLIKEFGLYSVAKSEDYLINTQKLPDPTTGWAANGNKTLFYDEGRVVAWTHKSETQWFYGGEFGGYTHKNEKGSWLNLKYDFENNKIYASCALNGVETTPVAFTDFFNQDLYPAKSGSFREFTTGEVFLSISYDYYKLDNEPARVDIFSIGDTKVSDLFDQAGFDPTLGESQHKLVDDVAPQINVDFVPTYNDGAYVAVGDKFTIPASEAIDLYLVGGVTVKAYQNYKTANQLELPIVDGKFEVPFADTYHIVYTAKDTSGNIAEKVIKIYGFNTTGNTIDIVHNTEQFTELEAGVINTFVLPTSISTPNLREGLKLRIEIANSYETIVIADLQSLEEIEAFLASSDLPTYKLSYRGRYEVKYYLADNAFNNYYAPTSYAFNVSNSDAKAIFDTPFMYKYYIKDAKYDFDRIPAYTFSTGKPTYAADAELWIKFDGGEYVKQNSVYSVAITGSQTIQAKYVYGNAVVETGVYPIVDVDYSDSPDSSKDNFVSFGKYFVGDFKLNDTKLDGSPTSDLFFTSNVKTGNNVLKYVKPINLKTFEITYRVEEDYGNLNGIRFTLTDIYDENNYISVYIYNEGNNKYVQYNDEVAQKLSASFIGAVDHSVAYRLDTNSLSVTDFTGYINSKTQFTSDEAYLEIELCDITGNAGITVKTLNLTRLTKQFYDRNAPSFVGTIPSGTYNIGDVITINPARFADDASVLEVNKTKFIAKLGSTYLVSKDQVVLDGTQDPTRSYEVELTELGRYSVQYIGVDAFNNKQQPTFYFSVKDNVAPEITFSGSIKEDVIVYAKPGYVVKLNFTLSDNYTSTEILEYRIFVYNTFTGNMYSVTEKSFKLDYEGTYEVSVVCYDTDNNTTTKTFTVVISNEEVK